MKQPDEDVLDSSPNNPVQDIDLQQSLNELINAARAFGSPKIDEEHMDRYGIRAHHPRSPEADVYRLLRTQVLHLMKKSGARTLAITSPRYGDGKSTVAINLGISIALDV